MNYKEFQRQLGKAGLTNTEFAELLKMNQVSICNYSKKDCMPTHLAVIAILMGELAENNVDFKEILRNIEIQPKKARGSKMNAFGFLKK